VCGRGGRGGRASGRIAASSNLRHALGTPKHSADLPPGLRMTHLPEALCLRKVDDANHDLTQHRKLLLLHPTCIHHAWRGKGEGGASADLLIFASFSCFSLLGESGSACDGASAQHRQGHFTRAPTAEQIETHAAARMPICSHRRCKQIWAAVLRPYIASGYRDEAS
jgi:hypothetical protein